MKFRTKIWMLPLSAALVFLAGVAISYAVGSRTLQALHGLSGVEAPALAQLRQAHQGVEQFRLLLQSAAVEGDADKLKEVDGSVARTSAVLGTLAAIPGKAALADGLRKEWADYHSAALGAVRAMLAKADAGDQVKRMQAAQGRLDTGLDAALRQAVEVNEGLQAQAVRGVESGLWVTLGIGVAVLAVLAAASSALIRSVWRELGEEPGTLQLVTRRIAEGDLQLDRRDSGDARSLDAAITAMSRRLRDMVGTIRDASRSIASASGEIATGNEELSVRTEASAASLEETAAAISQLSQTVQQSAEAAREASRLAGAASDAAQRGGEIVSQVVTSMGAINSASVRIGDIIGVIDGIAFQTNILALNAAVEAARAGDQGRGFAVVAGEVRSLAQRSAAAAREIKDLIAASTTTVQGGTRLVEDAGGAMRDIVTGVQRVRVKIDEISTGAADQSATIGEVHRAASQLEVMTQQNSTLVEEAAAAAGSLRDLAAQLQKEVDAFRLGGGHDAPAAPEAQGPGRFPSMPLLAAA